MIEAKAERDMSMPLSDWEPDYASRAARMSASEIRELLKLLDRPEIISFAGGIPDPALFPRDEVARAYAEIMGDPALASAALQYSVSEGYLPLRHWITELSTISSSLRARSRRSTFSPGSCSRPAIRRW